MSLIGYFLVQVLLKDTIENKGMIVGRRPHCSTIIDEANKGQRSGGQKRAIKWMGSNCDGLKL